MNGVKRASYRTFQFVFMRVQRALPWRVPELLTGPGAVRRLPETIRSQGVDSVLVVTDQMLTGLGLLDGLYEALAAAGVRYAVFDGSEPNPSIENVEEAYAAYLAGDCKAIIAVGGGSSMDCAKAAGARAANPKKSVQAMGGLLKVTRKLPPLYAVPTTAGTGSETTIVAVITNRQEKHKYNINDLKLIPLWAVLDPELTLGLPPQITGTTGMDALTHAVEAYTNSHGTRFAYQKAEEAVKLIYDNVLKAYHDGSDLAARDNMLKGAHFAGIAFTRNCVGYVHAVGHTLGGMYGVPHGLAMSVILPQVMRKFLPAAAGRLAALAELVGISSGDDNAKALAFIERIEEMNAEMGIPTGFDCIREEDIPTMIGFAMKEANPLYPVPVLWGYEEFDSFYRQLRL